MQEKAMGDKEEEILNTFHLRNAQSLCYTAIYQYQNHPLGWNFCFQMKHFQEGFSINVSLNSSGSMQWCL